MKSALLTLVCCAAAVAAMAGTPESTSKDFFDYLLAGKKDISTDAKAQALWLSKSVRQSLQASIAAAAKEAKAHPKDQVDSPDNHTFLSAWEAPTTYKITGAVSTAQTAQVQLRYEWGPKTNYPGDTRAMTVVMVREGDGWRVSDILTHKGKYCSEDTLLNALKRK